MRTLQEVKDFFQNDVYATGTTGIEIVEARPGYAKVTLDVDARHMNAGGRVMGAVYYTMADFAFAVANNYDMEEGMTVTLTSQINFLDAARGKTLTAEAHVIRDGRNTTFYRVDVTDELGTQIATVSSNGFRIRKK
ncbi:MAG: PaaI family thioesterase [Lachnospiraceae bacterium]|jgi:acyl-CoA thioesterase|nr:PaaI family thioesterase [Lachnospiraceae bacterium]